MIIKRDLIEDIRIFLKRREFIAIVGPRQVGKTTFLEIIKGCLIKDFAIKEDLIKTVSFEDRILLKQFQDEPVEFVNSFITGGKDKTFFLMIDEFQYVDKGGQKLKLIYDTIKNVKIIVTGSSSLELKAQVGKYLVGRILTFHLYPFNFNEVLRSVDSRLEKIYEEKNRHFIKWLFDIRATWKYKEKGEDLYFEEMIRYYERFCICGGYPAVVLSIIDRERHKILREIYNSYILKDIKGLLELTTEKELLTLSQYLATQIANICNYNNLTQVSNLNYRQLKKHLNILKETFVIDELRPFFKNKQKELSKNPKIYFLDTGFRNSIIENMNLLNIRPDAGALVENEVFIRLKELCRDSFSINFWRTKIGAEVDFILKLQNEIVPIEIKFSKFKDVKLSKSFVSFINSFSPLKGVILTKNFWGRLRKKDTEVLFVPIYYL